MCDTNVKLTANNGNVLVFDGNPNLDGTGAIENVLTAGDDGTLINGIIIKATGNTNLGMIRLFINDGAGSIMLFKEVMVPANMQTPVVPAFSARVDSTFTLKSGYSLMASTQNTENFNVVATASNWENCECPE